MNETDKLKLIKRLRPNRIQLILSLLLTLALCLSACGTINSNCPPYPRAGKRVADELENVCGGNLEKCPGFANWLDRIDKLRQQLEVCR